MTRDSRTRRRAPVLVAAILAAAVGCGGAGRPERIVLLVADTLRRDHLAPYGAELETPNLQQLADDGVVFRNAIASFHQTTMSMGALFTGRTPSIESGDPAAPLPFTSRVWCGLARLAESVSDGCIPEDQDTLAEDLRAAGYETIGIQSNRLIFSPYGYERGFDRWIEVGERERPETPAGRVQQAQLRTGERVNERVFEALEDRRSDRFFLYVHYIDPHDYRIRADLGRYADGVRYLDRAVGELLDGLRSRGLLENAVVVFTADHGEYLGRRNDHPLPATVGHYGNPSFDSLLKIPLIVSPAPALGADALVRTQDMRSLIRQIAGLPPLEPADLEADEVFLTERDYQTYRRGRWKSLWGRGGRKPVLFDLIEDPEERVDVAAAHRDVLARHRARIVDLNRSLATSPMQAELIDPELTRDEEDRLRALGYLE